MAVWLHQQFPRRFGGRQSMSVRNSAMVFTELASSAALGSSGRSCCKSDRSVAVQLGSRPMTVRPLRTWGMSWSRVARRVALARCSWPVDMSVSPQQAPGPASWMSQPAAVSTSRASWATPGARASEKESTQSKTLGPPGELCWGFLPDSAPAPFCRPAPHSRHQQRPAVARQPLTGASIRPACF